MKFKKRFLCLSSDYRTNKWELTCPCKKSWKPNTTMMAISRETCPKCNTEQIVDYNKEGNDT